MAIICSALSGKLPTYPRPRQNILPKERSVKCFPFQHQETTSKAIEALAKKLRVFTRFKTLPLKAEETVTNISSVKLTPEQLDVLKNDLTHSICPPYINRSDVYTCFELNHR